MPSRTLTCRELVELVTDYFEATLEFVDQMRFEAHLAGCAGCRNHVEQMRQTIQITGTLADESISPDIQNELLALFRDWKRQGTNSPGNGLWSGEQ